SATPAALLVPLSLHDALPIFRRCSPCMPGTVGTSPGRLMGTLHCGRTFVLLLYCVEESRGTAAVGMSSLLRVGAPDNRAGFHIGRTPLIPAGRRTDAAPTCPALPVELGGLRLVQDDVRGPAAGVCLRLDGGGGRLSPSEGRPCIPTARRLDTTCRQIAQFFDGWAPIGAHSAESPRYCHALMVAYPAPVDVERPGPVCQHVRRDRARESRTGDYDRLERGH